MKIELITLITRKELKKRIVNLKFYHIQFMLSDKRIKHTFIELADFVETLYKFNQILLDELAEHNRTHTYIYKIKHDFLLQSIARSRSQINSIFLLFELKHYSDVNILMRNMAEKLLILHDLINKNNFKAFYDFTIISNFEIRNKIKSDTSCKDFLDNKFWAETPQRLKEYQLTKSCKTKWVRPNPKQLETIAKNTTY
jgi:hypothetical protein